MRFWSRFNHVIHYDEYKLLLYNAISNTFVELPPEKREYFSTLKAGDIVDLSDEVMLTLQLSMMKSLVNKNEDNEIVNLIKMTRRNRQSLSNILSLTLIPTRECNFKCTYCYEKDRASVSMDEHIEAQVLTFIAKFKHLDALNIVWFGGEPLLRFDIVERLTKKMLKLGIPHYSSDIITNSYLLNQEMADKFNDLHIKNVQVTVDGLEEVHNKRRMLINDGGTFKEIIHNIEVLLASSYQGSVAFRVNVDKSNKKCYNETHAFLKAKFPQDTVVIHPGITHSYSKKKHDSDCFSSQEEVAFYLEQNRRHNIKAINFFPKQKITSCIADSRNGYVVGPEGELYKCLANIGNKEEIVGYIDQEKPWNMALLGAWLEGQNALNDSRCAKCSILPICDGGCSYIRLKQYLEGKSINNCSYLKKHLSDLLKEYYDIKTQS